MVLVELNSIQMIIILIIFKWEIKLIQKHQITVYFPSGRTMMLFVENYPTSKG